MAEIGTDIIKAAAILRSGGLVAIPTETVYGLAANALNSDAVAGIFKAKNRPFFDPLIVHIHSISECEKYAEPIPESAVKLAEKLWPGPLTIVLPKKEIVPDLVTAGNDSVGLRVPDHTLTLELLRELDFPLAAPSANPFGYISPTSAMHVQQQLGNEIDYILDGGPCKVGLESTIVRFTEEIPEVLRLGGTAPEVIKNLLGNYKENLNQNSDPTAPGQLDKHYSPHTKIYLIEYGAEIPKHFENSNIALLRFHQYAKGFPKEHQYILSEKEDTKAAAIHLFEFLRILDQKKYSGIVAELVPETGLGRAINDRLKRAAAK
ncbi:MAG: threonylcarbamoyl-AMP synthase [Bacteroidetes bacterium]|nr:threonylcarbamoyl-AMP synthase [Bacteroidota bacterium]